MQSGFYDINKLSIKDLRRFYKDVLKLSYLVQCQSKYVEHEWRGMSQKYNISEFMAMVSKKNHNTCVDRSIQHHNVDSQVGEIGFKLHSGLTKDWHQINFFVSLYHLKNIVAKYELTMS